MEKSKVKRTEEREAPRFSRRSFFLQLASTAGLVGIHRLAKAMAGDMAPSQTARPICDPDAGIDHKCDPGPTYSCGFPGFLCDSHRPYECLNQFHCGSAAGDFTCEQMFTCRNGFDCSGSGPGPEFTCEGNAGAFTCDPYNQFTCSDFQCDQQFTCPVGYQCGDVISDYVCQVQFTCNQFNCEAVAEPGASFYCQNGFSCTNFQCDPGDFYCGPSGNMMGYTCFHPPQGYTCSSYQCGDAFTDYICQAQFTCQLFICEAVAEPGASFYCENGFNCASQATQQPFWCDPGDFYCGPNNNYVGYRCNGLPGRNYSMPIKKPVVPIEISP